MRRLRFHRPAVRRHQHAGHQSERAEPLRHHVGFHVAVVVLARPHQPAIALEHLGDHVVDQAMVVADARGLELRLELGLVDLLEQVLEPAVVCLQDRVLGRQVQRVAPVERVPHGGAGEVADRIVEVVHAHGNAAAGEARHLQLKAFGRGSLVRQV